MEIAASWLTGWTLGATAWLAWSILAAKADARPDDGSPVASPAPTLSQSAPAGETAAAAAARAALVDGIAARQPGLDPRVLAALRTVPRHLFMPDASLEDAYADQAFPIGHRQTISQPTVVAMMTDALELSGNERVLEVGTGSGYQAAVLSHLARRVYSIEIVEPLGLEAKARLARLGHANVEVRIGDGYAGWPELAPFDRIILTAAPPALPQALVDQLAVGGVIVGPVGVGEEQWLGRWIKRADGLESATLGGVRFVPMVTATPVAR